MKNIFRREVSAEEIQTDLSRRTDAALDQAIATLMAPSPVTERAKRLERLGFSGHKDAEAMRQHDEKVRLAEAKQAVFRKYAEKYPTLKFVTTEDMREVCRKYGLLLGQIHRYTGDVPDWAMDRIEQCGVPIFQYSVHVDASEVPKDGVSEQYVAREIGIARRFSMAFGLPGGYYGSTVMIHTYNKELAEALVGGWKTNIQKTNTLMIAAPVAQMKLHPSEEVRIGEIVQPKDPIVCFCVPEGYIVITAWDEEGRDPRILNATNN